MEQMYLVEIFIDKVMIVAQEEESSANKSLIIKIKFGPKVQFIIKEGQLAKDQSTADDIIECDTDGKRKWARTIRVGKSYLFPSYPDTVMMTLSKFPLEIEVWNDDETETEIFVGIGTMYWDTQFFHMLKETSEPCKRVEPLTIKQKTTLYAECCCKQVGDISFILRLGSLGDSIITEFQQLMKDPDNFVFRTNRAPSMFNCKRIEGDDPNFCMVGSLYETTTLEDPEVTGGQQNHIEVCTDLQSCAVGESDDKYKCEHNDDRDKPTKKKYPLDKIRMGDITGPCGNTNCTLAHKVRTYIRNLDTYKKAAGTITNTKDTTTRNICGTCSCKDDRWHREECEDSKGEKKKVVCSGCGGITQAGTTCEDRQKKLFGTGATPKGSKTQITYVFNDDKMPNYDSIYGSKFTVQNASIYNNRATNNKPYLSHSTHNMPGRKGGCCCANAAKQPSIQMTAARSQTAMSDSYRENMQKNNSNTINTTSQRSINAIVYNVATATSTSRTTKVYTACTEVPEDKSCKCNPPKPTPPCHTFDCECITEGIDIALRKAHKPYCPSFKHKPNCPVTMENEEEELKEQDEVEDTTEKLPYGLPPIQLGPCPVLGRPCTVPDGFARMYKTGAMTPQPPSYSDAGKVCCSREYEKIKKAIKDYMKYEKDDDFRCINKFNVDTERRCCDKEQRLLALMGKECCGTHKLAIQQKFKENKQ